MGWVSNITPIFFPVRSVAESTGIQGVYSVTFTLVVVMHEPDDVVQFLCFGGVHSFAPLHAPYIVFLLPGWLRLLPPALFTVVLQSSE